MEIHEKGDLSLLIKDDSKHKESELIELWDKLTGPDFINEIGVSDSYRTYKKLLAKYVYIKCKYLITQNNKLYTKMMILELKLKKYQKNKSKGKENVYQVAIGISRALGGNMHISVNQINVVEYYSYLNYIAKLPKSKPNNVRGNKRK